MELKFDPENPIYVHVTTENQLNEALEDLEKNNVVGVDTEGTSLDPYSSILLTVQVGTPEKTYIFDARELNLREIPRFKEYLENPKIIKILHNGKFDYKHIKQILGISVCNLFDTMLTETILNAGLSSSYYSLKDLAKKYTGIDLKKSVRETFEYMTASTRMNETQLRYSAMDTLILFPIFNEQIKKLKKESLIDIAKLEYATTRVVGDMELKGVHLDVKRWRRIINDISAKRDELAKKFQQEIRPYFKSNTVDLFGNIGDCININSQVQLMDLFNNKMNLNLPSTGDGILELCNDPIVKILREYRGNEKLVSAFGENLLSKLNPVTKRIHPDFNQLGAATGRFSCNNPNFQQIPRQSENAPFRSCFNPEKGYKLVTTDYSSFEMRIMAELSGDQNLIEAFKRGVDVHSHTAALMFGLELTDDFKKTHPDERFAAKSINFGLMYGRGPSSLAKQLGISAERGREYLDKYFKSYPGVKNIWKELQKKPLKKVGAPHPRVGSAGISSRIQLILIIQERYLILKGRLKTTQFKVQTLMQ